jgi:hypothetical protein
MPFGPARIGFPLWVSFADQQSNEPAVTSGTQSGVSPVIRLTPLIHTTLISLASCFVTAAIV